ncbi:MAG TPA: CCA tRNA nucleotidyltransferase [Candidatus Limnocylindrales bacterium]|nr:CCA tRNA nucleotidyltransferase [Candidatus Limnocylindrales bacterium]
MAQLSLPGRRGPDPGLIDGASVAIDALPEGPRGVLAALAEAGHEAALVGGCLRDLLRGESPDDWDVATAALPEQVSALLAGSSWENRFGTVIVPGPVPVEVTTYRSESTYSDRRRPDDVTFHGSLAGDLARRDFTINAIAWLPDRPGATAGRLVDPHGGLADLRAGRIRAVGAAEDRFAEDALRVLRGVRFALRFDFEIEPATEAALAGAVPLTRGLSGERVRDELLRLLGDAAIAPSAAIERWERLALLGALVPELAALRGVPQNKPRGGDALDHAAWTADALPARDAVLRLAGLLHDLGKAETLAGGHFIGHEVVGAQLAEEVMRRLRFGGREIARVRHLVRQHMFAYDAGWTDAAVRRFIVRVGHAALDDLFALRHADNAASGVAEPDSGGLDELRRRIAGQKAAPMAQRQLAVDGHDLQRELGIEPGPEIGRLLHRLLDAVVEDPGLNDRERLLDLARETRAAR